MAEAKVVPARTRTETVVVEPEKVVLSLSREEAHMILSITGRFIAGGPTSGIYEALYGLLNADGWASPKYNIKHGLKDFLQPVQTLHLLQI